MNTTKSLCVLTLLCSFVLVAEEDELSKNIKSEMDECREVLGNYTVVMGAFGIPNYTADAYLNGIVTDDQIQKLPESIRDRLRARFQMYKTYEVYKLASVKLKDNKEFAMISSDLRKYFSKVKADTDRLMKEKEIVDKKYAELKCGRLSQGRYDVFDRNYQKSVEKVLQNKKRGFVKLDLLKRIERASRTLKTESEE